MFAPFTGLWEGDWKAEEEALPQAQECLITVLSGFSEKAHGGWVGGMTQLRSKPYASLEAIT